MPKCRLEDVVVAGWTQVRARTRTKRTQLASLWKREGGVAPALCNTVRGSPGGKEVDRKQSGRSTLCLLTGSTR